MIYIAVCDDHLPDAQNLKKMIIQVSKEIGMQIQIDLFESGTSLIKSMKLRDFDLIFLDIKMGKENGLEIARIIRETNDTVLIIYVTNYDQYAIEAYETLPFRFIVKPVHYEILKKYCLQAYERILEDNFFYEYKWERNIYRVRVNQIMYFESRKRKVYIHLQNGELLVYYDRLNRVEEYFKTQKAIFWRVHQSFFVNTKYIIRKNHDSVVLFNGEIIPVSEERRKHIDLSYFRIEERRMRSE